ADQLRRTAVRAERFLPPVRRAGGQPAGVLRQPEPPQPGRPGARAYQGRHRAAASRSLNSPACARRPPAPNLRLCPPASLEFASGAAPLQNGPESVLSGFSMRVCVIGAGVVGVTSAYFLARQGHEVVLVDSRARPATVSSYANGGQLSYSYVAP